MTTKEYKKQFYLSNRNKYLIESRERYLKNKETIVIRRKLKRENETQEQRIKRLAFHKEYNRKNKDKNSLLAQSDESKFKQYSSSAKRRSYEFNLSFYEFVSIFHSKCSYCGKDDSRGIDRVDNKIGYIVDNSVPCCDICNKMKWRYTTKQFLEHITKIANFIKNT